MKLSHFFIDRPIFATVISIITVIIGGIAFFALPIAQYPEVAPPTIQVTAIYPGASAETIAATVATPLEQEINGVEDMIYMSSQSTNDGQMSITITFKVGTDLDKVQVLVQNRVAIAEPRLPEEVKRLGITTKKNSPDLMTVINLYSPKGTYDQTYIANYATLQIKDILSRIAGVGDIRIFGASPYSMRIWLDPDRVSSYGVTPAEVISALRSQNLQVASGTLNQLPGDSQDAFEINVRTKGRLVQPSEFEDIIIKAGPSGRVVKIRDVGRVELGAESYATKGYLGDKAAVALPIFQKPGSNAIETVKEIKEKMKELSKNFPADLKYDMAYNPTEFVEQSIEAVAHTIFEAILLVVLVIILFLQSWRAAIIPVLAIPVSLIGTFAVMNAIGYSLNNLTLFGLVLAIGIVVDDAIVVVENAERNLEKGMEPREAIRLTMNEVGSALVAMGLVLVAVFLPTTFITGISGQFYKQFGVTIAVSTMISVAVSLILSPAIAKLLLRRGNHEHDPANRRIKNPVDFIFVNFNKGLNYFSERYSKVVATLVRRGGIVLVVYLILIGLTGFVFAKVPTGFIPAQDQGYLIVAMQLPPGSSLSRTDEILKKAAVRLLKIKGVKNAVAFAGFSGATFSSASNAATVFLILKDFKERNHDHIKYKDLVATIRNEMNKIDDAIVVVIPPPPVRGIGSAGGFKMMIQDKAGHGVQALEGATWALAMAANNNPITTNSFTLFETKTPQLYVDIDYDRAQQLGVPPQNIYDALQIYYGSAFVNDFNFLGRTYRVTAQADNQFRKTDDDIARIKIRNREGEMVSLGSVTKSRYSSGPSRVPRYNLYPAAELFGDTKPGHSTGESLAEMERLAKQILPQGFGFEWTDVAFQERQSGNTGIFAFAFAIVFVFLLLAAQYESWILPLAVILIVPMCLLSAMTGVSLAGMDNNILTQIGLVVLIGLASKNAILIVEFAKQKEDEGMELVAAAIEAAKLRLRPILMTAFAFILGVLPLVYANGAGAEMRRALGTAVFSGMLGVTFFGLLFTPVFYVLSRRLGDWVGTRFRKRAAHKEVHLNHPTDHS